MRKQKALLAVLPLAALLAALAIGLLTQGRSPHETHAAWVPCHTWDHCPVTQYYGHNGEHGVDLYTPWIPITAKLGGTITFVHTEYWDTPSIQDITWKLDQPWLARGSPYMYVQINVRAWNIVVGRHIWAGTYLGYSRVFIEFGLTPDWAYGISNWRWGVNPLTVWPSL